MEENFGIGVDPEIVREFEGLWTKVRITGSSKQALGYLKKAGERAALFVSPTKQAPFAVLYDNLEEISAYTGTLRLPGGLKEVQNGKVVETATNEV
jgi:hypothetical protein